MTDKSPMGGGTLLFLVAPLCGVCGWNGLAQVGINAKTILEVISDLAEHQDRTGHRRRSPTD